MEIKEEEIQEIIDASNEDADFSDKYIRDDTCEKIATLLRASNKKKRLSLRSNYIGADGLVAIAELIKSDMVIKELNLEWNQVGSMEHGIMVFSSALETNQCLVSLNLCNNHISTQGAKNLARALRTNQTLESVDLRWNEVGTPGAAELEAALRGGGAPALRRLFLAGNQVDDALLESLEALLKGRDAQRLGAQAAAAEPERRLLEDDLHVARSAVGRLEKQLALRDQEDERLQAAHAEKVIHLETEIENLHNMMAEEEIKFKAEIKDRDARALLLEEKARLGEARAEEARAALAEARAQKQAAEAAARAAEGRLADTQADAEKTQGTLQRLLDQASDERNTALHELEQQRTAASDRERSSRQEIQDIQFKLKALEREIQQKEVEKGDLEATIVALRKDNEILDGHCKEQMRLLEAARTSGREQVSNIEQTLKQRQHDMEQTHSKEIKIKDDSIIKLESTARQAENQRQNALKALSQLKVEMETRLLEQESKLTENQRKIFDSQQKELEEKVEAIKQSREQLQLEAEALASKMEDMKLSSARELQQYTRQCEKLSTDLHEARENARTAEAENSDAKTEVLLMKQKCKGLEQMIFDLQQDKKQLQSNHDQALEKVRAAAAAEARALRTAARRARAAADAARAEGRRHFEMATEAQARAVRWAGDLEERATREIELLFKAARRDLVAGGGPSEEDGPSPASLLPPPPGSAFAAPARRSSSAAAAAAGRTGTLLGGDGSAGHGEGEEYLSGGEEGEEENSEGGEEEEGSGGNF